MATTTIPSIHALSSHDSPIDTFHPTMSKPVLPHLVPHIAPIDPHLLSDNHMAHAQDPILERLQALLVMELQTHITCSGEVQALETARVGHAHDLVLAAVAGVVAGGDSG